MAENEHGSTTERPSLAVLAATVVTNVVGLAKAEVAALVGKAKAFAIKVGLAVGLFAAAALLAIIVLCYLVFAAYLGFAHVLPDWAAALVVALVFALLAGGLAAVALRLLKRAVAPKPAETVNQIKGGVSAAVADAKARVRSTTESPEV